MKTHTFKGGIHPPEMKELSRNAAIVQVFPASKTVTIPVTMGGAPNTPIVKVGDVVKRGQVIAKSDAFMSAPVHASVSGKVKKIQSALVTGNLEVPCITIEADGSEETDFMRPLDPFTCEAKEALQRIRDAGIVGMGGASFPTHVKLNPPPEKEIAFVLLNAAECEPYLTVDERTLQECTEKVIDGLAIELKLTGARGIIALEDNKAHIQPLLVSEIAKKGYADDMQVVLVKTKYPQGGEKNLVEAVLGVEIPSGGLPADAGVIISNVGTACAISDAFRLGMPLIDRALTISGGACKNPCNIRVPVGTIVADLIPDVFTIMEENVAKIISGGPMMGFAMPSTQFPVAKGTSGITFLTEAETYLTDEGQCINCGSCLDACPMHLSPVLMMREATHGNLEKAKRFGLMDCIECGCCSYVCPASIRLVQHFRLGKNAVRARLAMQKASGGQKSAEKKRRGSKKMTETKKTIFLSASPHFTSQRTTQHIMATVLLSLLPECVYAIIVFGLRALLLLVVSVASAVLFEYVFQKVTKQKVVVSNLSAAVTGVLLALVVPSTTPLWMIVLGNLVAIVVAKGLFGGIGSNVFNPALTGRAFLFMSFAAILGASWFIPTLNVSKWAYSLTGYTNVDVISSATLLSRIKAGTVHPDGTTFLQYFIGYRSGCLGETSALLILLSFVFLLVTGIIDVRAPLAMVGTVFGGTYIHSLATGRGLEGALYDALFALLTGGLLFGAVFMATDYATTPVTKPGRWIFGAGCGLITFLIRTFGGYPEGVMFSILIMNALSPFLNNITVRKYGYGKRGHKRPETKRIVQEFDLRSAKEVTV